MRCSSCLERGRADPLDEQAALRARAEPDLVCLQEVTPVTAERRLDASPRRLHGALAPLRNAREAAGVRPRSPPARGELDVISVADVPWLERVLAAGRAGSRS